MASQSLYRKWRSQTFSELVGQEQIVKTLKNTLDSGNLAHAYLFCGPRGTGKTSMARLLAKTINCLSPVNGEPCNTCEQCREITAGSSFNVIEIDAASNRGIDSIRELREKVMMPPTVGRYKVYILDEAHMLTTEAFNALLKTLEEPPPHAIFVMATTDVHKMLPTVLSRCQRFDFKRFTLRQLVSHLYFVAEQEQVRLEEGAGELLARAAAGGMRDALSLLDQAIAYAGNVITLANVQEMLGVADPRAIQRFILAVADMDSPAGLHLIHELSEAGADLRQINQQVADFWRGMMLAKAGANIAEILDSTDSETREMKELAKRFALDELTECARLFAQNDLIQRNQGTPQLGLELGLLTSVELHRRFVDGTAGKAAPTTTGPRPASSPLSHQTHAPVERPRSAPTSQPASSRAMTNTADYRTPPPDIESSAPSVPVQPQEVQTQQPPAAQAMPTPVQADVEVTATVVPAQPDTQVVPPVTPVVAVEVETTQAHSDSNVSENPPSLTIEQVKERWEYILRRVRTRKDGGKISAVLKGYTIVKVEGVGALPVVVIKAGADFHYKMLQGKEEYIETIRWATKIELDTDCDVRLLSPAASVVAHTALHIPPPASATSAPPKSDPGIRTTPAPAPAISVAPPPVEKQTTPPPVQQPPQPPAVASPTVPATPAPVPQEKAQEPEAVLPVTIPLARKAVVRENTTVEPEKIGTRLQALEKYAKSDPVVKEVVRMFKAEIKDIQPK
ncbi:MAG TPA: DNA polymerase III subunit gamma/tau [Dictyobacter sp.]|jgi:DNA polymerase-3 subunit gamma/tau|nr:DNA polymerase III subunit gamma/tau [Dictyobacter sp.]